MNALNPRKAPCMLLGMMVCLNLGGLREGVCAEAAEVIAPPESFWEIVAEEDREVARGFYTKYMDANGVPVLASGEVADEALLRSHEIVSRMLAGRPDIIQALIDTDMYVVIIGKDQYYTDMPEYRNRPTPEYLNERVRDTDEFW